MSRRTNRRERLEKRKERRMRQRRIGLRTSRKLIGLFLLVVVCLAGLALRITYINASQGERYARIVQTQAQQQYSSATIPYRRGDITDPTDKNYPGPTPASEVSTQAIEKLIDETPHIFGIDHHIYGSCFGSNPICVAYTVSNQRESSLVYAFAEWVSAQVMKKLPSYMSTDSYKIDKHIPYKISIGDGDGAGYLYAKFNRGLLLETMTKWGHSESESGTKDNERETEKSSHQFNVENLATMMHTAWVVHNNL